MSKFWRVIFALSLIGNLFVFYVAMKAIEYRTHINFFLDKYLTVVSEFSRRSYFEEENWSLASDTTIPNRVVFFGTQVTERWPVDSLFAPEYEAVNRGIYGQRVAGMLLRFIPDVVALSPAAVVIEVSSYNFRPENTIGEVEDYVRSMCQLARANRIDPILTTTVPFRNRNYDLEGYSLTDSVAIYNTWIREAAKEEKIPLVDFNRILADSAGYLPDSLSFDDIDPNPAGYAVMTSATKQALAEVARLRAEQK